MNEPPDGWRLASPGTLVPRREPLTPDPPPDEGSWANEEIPAGQIDGVTVSFALAHAPTPPASLQLVLNGMVLHSGAGNDFTLSGSIITFAYAPAAGSSLICWYEY